MIKCGSCDHFYTYCKNIGSVIDDPRCNFYRPLEKRFFAAWILWVVLGGMAVFLAFGFVYFIGMAWR